MNCLSQVSSYTAAIFRITGRSFSATSYCPWKTKANVYAAGISLTNSESSAFSRLRTQLYSSSKTTKAGAATKTKTTSSRSPRKKKKSEAETVMEPEKDDDAFYVVRKGDIVGVYKSFSDCQAQQGSSICDPPVSVYKGFSMPKDSKDYLASRGLQNALYTIRADDVKGDLFGKLVPCSLQEPTSSKGETSVDDASKKRPHQESEPGNVDIIGSTSISDTPSTKQAKTTSEVEVSPSDRGCILYFDGASKGNPGAAGAGVILRADDGSLICKLREGLGVATNNVAEYRAVILGLKYAIKKGFKRIFVLGDSKLVCMQVQGKWQVKNQNMCNLYEEVNKLKDKFVSFKINHVLRELNSEADAEANLAVTLADGQVKEV